MKKRWIAIVAPVVVVAAGCGNDVASTVAAGGVVEVSMTEMAYAPDQISVAAGEEVTFRFVNDGVVRHEALIGREDDQDDHASQMGGGGHDGHDRDVAVIVLDPGETGELSYRFVEGEYVIGCHEPGHYEAGMRATVTAA